jgi:predicted RNase H-like nuclease (RuvC/YqgF family)
MREDADTAQARELLHFLHAQVEEISQKLEAAENRTRQRHGRTQSFARREAASLRRELYEAHRLIDGLHNRFPATRPPRRWPAHPARSIGPSTRQVSRN